MITALDHLVHRGAIGGEYGSIRDEAPAAPVEHVIATGVHGLTPFGSTDGFAYRS